VLQAIVRAGIQLALMKVAEPSGMEADVAHLMEESEDARPRGIFAI
jgi:hypothetical protein